MLCRTKSRLHKLTPTSDTHKSITIVTKQPYFNFSFLVMRGTSSFLDETAIFDTIWTVKDVTLHWCKILNMIWCSIRRFYKVSWLIFDERRSHFFHVALDHPYGTTYFTILTVNNSFVIFDYLFNIEIKVIKNDLCHNWPTRRYITCSCDGHTTKTRFSTNRVLVRSNL